MNQILSQIALIVKDYDEAIEFYTQKLGFALVEDTILSETKRWVVVQPTGEGSCKILLAKANTTEQEKSIGNKQAAGYFYFYILIISREITKIYSKIMLQ